MGEPADKGEVLGALRLGWYVAELRGRCRPAGPDPRLQAMPTDLGHPLPLRVERSLRERRRECLDVMLEVASQLRLCDDPDADIRRPGFGGDTHETHDTSIGTQDGHNTVTVVIQPVFQAVGWRPAGGDLARGVKAAVLKLPEAPSPQLRALRSPSVLGSTTPDPDAEAWYQFGRSLYTFDAMVQDVLAGRSESQVAAYQLGRGLAEIYWALDMDVPQDGVHPSSWPYLLGPGRCSELSRLAGRVGGYFNPYAAPALAGTLLLWQRVAADPAWRGQPEASDRLYQQIRRWYEITMLGQDPSTLVKPYAIMTNFDVTKKVMKGLLPQLVFAAVSVLAVLVLVLLVQYERQWQWVKALLGVGAAAGLSVTTIQAKLKNEAQGLLTRVRQDAYADLVAAEVAVVPPLPPSSRARALAPRREPVRTAHPGVQPSAADHGPHAVPALPVTPPAAGVPIVQEIASELSDRDKVTVVRYRVLTVEANTPVP